MEKITVNLYNTNSNKEKCRAEEVYCNHYKECSLYKEGKCLNVTAPFSDSCKIGRKNIVRGYTQRAAKYYNFVSKYKNDEVYGKLKSPIGCKFFATDNMVYVNPGHVVIRKDGEQITIDNPGFFTSGVFLTKEEFSFDFLKRLVSFAPHAMMGGVITDYHNKNIPELLYQIKNVMPEFYQEFVSIYPEYDKKPDFIGKLAYLYTLNRDCEYLDKDGHRYHFEGDFLVGEFHSCFLPFHAKKSFVRIPLTKEMTYTITNNEQVTEETVFL